MKVSQLKTNPGNPRQIKGEKLELLKKSVASFQKMMELRPIIVDEGNVVLGGNMRLAAIRSLGLKEIPDEWVKQAEGLTEDEKKEFVIKDNSAYGEYDWDVIANEWSDLPLSDWGLDVPGFETIEPAGEADAEPQIDKAAELNKKWKVKSGDLWLIGEHRLICASCTDKEAVGRLMGQDLIDLCITSPPYNSGDGGFKTDYYGKTKRFYQDDTDNRTEQEWVEFCEDVLLTCSEYVRSDESPIVWNVMYNARCRSGYGQVMFRGVQPFTVKETICWDKGHGFPTASKGILSRNWELIFVLSKGEKYTTTQGDNEPRWCKWDIARPDEQEETHKATFPTGLPTRAIDEFSFSNSTVYDPFTGSGTTMIASANKGRKFVGCELSEEYCAVILERMATAFPHLEIRRDGKGKAAKT